MALANQTTLPLGVPGGAAPGCPAGHLGCQLATSMSDPLEPREANGTSRPPDDAEESLGEPGALARENAPGQRECSCWKTG